MKPLGTYVSRQAFVALRLLAMVLEQAVRVKNPTKFAKHLNRWTPAPAFPSLEMQPKCKQETPTPPLAAAAAAPAKLSQQEQIKK